TALKAMPWLPLAGWNIIAGRVGIYVESGGIMVNRIGLGLSWIVVGILAVFVSVPARATPRETLTAAPVPAEIISAKRIFISNAGRGCSPFGNAYFSGGPDRSYDQFYTAMKSWGRYQLAHSPSAAELDFAIELSCPPVTTAKGGAEIHAGSTYDPQLRLIILDLKTHTVLWTITVHVSRAILQGNRDKNFDRAMAALLTELKDLAAPPAPTPSTPKNGS
ncbi:MAG: hypothetical protein P8Z30_20210, partial [Acidobacteriota bacterium]